MPKCLSWMFSSWYLSWPETFLYRKMFFVFSCTEVFLYKKIDYKESFTCFFCYRNVFTNVWTEKIHFLWFFYAETFFCTKNIVQQKRFWFQFLYKNVFEPKTDIFGHFSDHERLLFIHFVGKKIFLHMEN